MPIHSTIALRWPVHPERYKPMVTELDVARREMRRLDHRRRSPPCAINAAAICSGMRGDRQQSVSTP
jgi:hypothetical protein